MNIPAFFQNNILTLERIVEVINDGGTSSSTPEELAGYYAFDAAREGSDNAGDIDSDTIEAHMDFLAEAGARFNYAEAVALSMVYVVELQAGE